MACVKAKVSKCGMMAANTKDFGRTIWPMVEVGLFMLTGMFMKENGLTTRHMVKEYISM